MEFVTDRWARRAVAVVAGAKSIGSAAWRKGLRREAVAGEFVGIVWVSGWARTAALSR